MFSKKYVCIKQHDMKDCGAACLATLAKHYGMGISISKLREYSGTDNNGTSVKGLIEGAERIGFTAKAVRASNESLFENFPLPAIAHVIIDESLLHYVVIHKITKNHIIIADPAKGIKKYTLDEFYEIWTNILILALPTENFKKEDQTKGLFSRFLKLLLPQKGLLLQIFFASLIFTVFGIVSSFHFQLLIDEILPYQQRNTLHIISIGIILLYLFKVLLDAFRTYLLLYLSQRLDTTLILGYYKHVVQLPMNFFSTRKVGEILSRLMDASKVREALSSATLTIVLDVLMILIVGFVLFFQNSFLFTITLAFIPFYILIVFLFKKPFENTNRKEMELSAELNSFIIESVNGIETVKAYNAERFVDEGTEHRFIKLMKTVFRLGMLDNVQTSVKTGAEMIGGVLILWVGSYQVMNNQLSIGQLLTFNALIQYFLGPIQNIINLQPQLQSAFVAADRLSEILDVEIENTEAEYNKIKNLSLKGHIDISNIQFRYGTRQLILNNLNLSVKPGERVAIVGESGSGKTTFIKLLMRFYEAEKGEILINGINIKDANVYELRKRIAYISQQNFFFSGSIRDNLTMGRHDISMEEMIASAKISQAHDFINSLPVRYDTLLEENASNLSGGQRQRLAITRALLQNPDILIMDEATSNLDSTTEKSISEAILDYGREVTMFIIAHRLSTIMKCDKICVMDKGTIVEIGSHEELMKQKGKYYDLWKDQIPDHYEEIEREAVYASLT